MLTASGGTVDRPDIADHAAGATDSGRLVIFTSAKTRHARASLVGDLDMTTAQGLTSWAERIARAMPRSVRLDATGLRFADVCGVRALARACWLLSGHRSSFQLVGLPAEVRRVADLTGADLPTTGVPVSHDGHAVPAKATTDKNADRQVRSTGA